MYVKILYCGMCNPQIDYEVISKKIKENPTVNCVDDIQNADVIITFHGCRRCKLPCTTPQKSNIVIQGTWVDNSFAEENMISEKIIEKIDIWKNK